MAGRRTFLFSSLALATTGCGIMRFPVSEDRLNALERQGINVIPVTTDNILQVRMPTNSWISQRGSVSPPPPVHYTYRVGQGDVLQIRFYADPAGIKESSDFAPQTAAVIDESGKFFFPFVGKVAARGRTVGQIRTDLTKRLEEFFTMPQVEVSVANFNAHHVTITGAVGQPGRRTLTNVPTTLLDLVNEVGRSPASDFQRISLRRRGHEYTVNLQAFLNEGRAGNNPILLPGDIIRVPEDEDNKIFTFGEITAGEIPLTDARKTLVEVLAESGGVDRFRADTRGIFVFRRNTPEQKGFDVYQFDLSNAGALILAAEFVMAPLDIVFVTNDPATRWSDTIGKILQPLNSILAARTTATRLTE